MEGGKEGERERGEEGGRLPLFSWPLKYVLDLLVSEVDIIVTISSMSFLSLLSPVDQPVRGKQGH